MLSHARQQGGPTCLYHAAFALTGDPRLLAEAEHAREPDNEVEWAQVLAARGLLVFDQHCTQRDYGGQVTPPLFWERLRARAAAHLQPHETLSLLVVILEADDHDYHAVAAEIPMAGDTVSVSDSHLTGVLFLSWAEFLHSRYARAYRVQQLLPSH